MPPSPRGQFGPHSLLTLLALSAGQAVAENLPPLRVNPALLGAGTPPAPLSAPPVAAAAPAAIETSKPPAPPAPAPVVAAPAVATPAWVAPAPTPAPTPAPVLRAPVAPARVASPGTPLTPVSAPAAAPAAVPVAPAAPTAKTVPAALPPRREDPPEVAEMPAVAATYSAHIAAGLLPTPRLHPHPRLPGETLPTFIAADHIVGRKDDELVAEGDAELRKRDTVMEADRLTYWQKADEFEAVGNVRLTRGNDRVRGPRLKLNLDNSTGVFEQPDYFMRYERKQPQMTPALPSTKLAPATVASGKADRMLFEGENHYRLSNATYSTCTPEDGKEPDWFARVSDLQLDYDDESGTARDATLVFKGTPILYAPWLSFSLNNQRKSGLLTPTMGTTSRGGLEYLQPIYWNIAPNMDATLTPRYMSKRGVQWNGEYRYLEQNYNGIARVEYLPDDSIEHKRRSAYAITHNQNLGAGFSAALNFNGVSDDTYFSDLSTRISAAAQGNLLRQGTLSYASTWWQARLMAQTYQTLQDPALPALVTPYRRLPELRVTAARGDLPAGVNFNFLGEHVNFRHGSLVQGKRFTLYPQLSLPLQNEAFYVTPKLGLHATRYTLSNQAAGTPEQLARNLPIVSVDSGVTFERQTDWFGSAMTQTLEPRLYYLYVPQRDQSLYPVFDTAVTDFNFAQMFAENLYGGGDRIADANQVTAMVSSRLLDPASGGELVRAAFGQRFYFTTQHVGLPGETLRADRQTDLLAALSGRLLPKTYIDTAAQYNPRAARLERLNLSGRYQPEAGKLLNVAYRYTRELAGVNQAGLGQFDVSGQWPLGDGWSAVGRYNYSLKDHRIIENILGAEKDGGCWVLRFVVQRIATQAQNSNTAIFVQLELNGFSRIGSNPLELLKRNIPGYGVINQPTADPAFAAQ